MHELAGLTWDDVLERVGTLPPDSVALAVVFFADATGRTFGSLDAYVDLAAAANRPMFATSSTFADAGLVGGLVIDYRLVGRRAARAAAAELTGRPRLASNVVEAAESRWMFDARQLARWGIRESALPAGSEILFREPSFFQRYRNPALVALAVVALQAAIIGMLLIERRVRRRTEAQNHAVLTSMSADLAVIDRHGHVVSSNDGWARAAAAAENPFVGAGRGQRWLHADGAPPQDGIDTARLREALDAVLEEIDEERIVECSWQANGQRKWSHVRVKRLLGRPGGAVVTHVDISARKRAETEVQQTLHEMAHLNMRAGMGEILASVAHEVNQPLTASLTNAQALKRLLAGNRAEPQEVVGILEDIIEADRRAIDVLAGIRKMLRKEEFDLRPLHLNAVVGDVVRTLTSSTANARRAARHRSRARAARRSRRLRSGPAGRHEPRHQRRSSDAKSGRSLRQSSGSPLDRTTARSVCWWTTRGPESTKARCRGSSSRFSRPNGTALAWACRSAVRSSRCTAAASTSPTSPRAARGSPSRCLRRPSG